MRTQEVEIDHVDGLNLPAITEDPGAAITALVDAACFLETAAVRLLAPNPEAAEQLFSDDEMFLMRLSSAVVQRWRQDWGGGS